MTPDGLLTLHGKDLTTHQEVQAELRTSAILTAEELAGRCTINKGFTVS